MADFDNSTPYLSDDDFMSALKQAGYLPSDSSSTSPDASTQNQSVDPTVSPYAPDEYSPNQSVDESLQSLPYYGSDANSNDKFPPATPAPATQPTVPTSPTPAAPTSQAPSTTTPQSSQDVLDQQAQNKSTNQSLKDSLNQALANLNNPDLNDQALKNAQNQVQNRQLFTGIGDALATFAAAGANQKPDEAFFKEQMANAQQPVQDIETRRANMLNGIKQSASIAELALTNMDLQDKQALNDPTSVQSMAFKRVIANGIDPNGTGITKTEEWQKLSGSDAAHLLPAAETFAKIQESKAQKDIANEMARTRIKDQETKADMASQQKMTDKVNSFTASARSALGSSGKSLINADRALDTLNNPNGITIQQMHNIASDLSSMYNNGSATVNGTNKNSYDTLYGKVTGLIQNLTGQPQDAVPDDIKNAVRNNLQQMRNISSNVVKSNFAVERAGNPAFEQHFPDWFDNMAKAIATQTSNTNNTLAQGNTPAQNTTTPQYKTGQTKQVGNFTYTRDANGNWTAQ
jgi:hypothetical protein